jgi:hypothetical protein
MHVWFDERGVETEPFNGTQKLARRRAITVTRLRYPFEQGLRRPHIFGVKVFGDPA